MTREFVERRRLAWLEPLEVAAGLRDRPGALALLSHGGALGRWSWVAAEPDRVFTGCYENGLQELGQPGWAEQTVGLVAYDGGARAATGDRGGVWPDLMLARYPSMLAFDHDAHEVLAIGRGLEAASARASVEKAQSWLSHARKVERPSPPSNAFAPEEPDERYLAAVEEVVQRIGRGELFQANVARAWSGRLHSHADPFDVLLRLSGRASAYGAYWRFDERAIVSNSPELFLCFDPVEGRLETRPIKGTRSRSSRAHEDARLARELAESAKDRAENLMIVDLMRNDLARVAIPGSVRTAGLFEVETLPTVHHLVSTVTAEPRSDLGAGELLSATFPPGSITGAPKHQAMKVIADLEPPRGAWCGSLFHLDEGRLTASVLIRTVSFVHDAKGWTWRAAAGAGVVADSDPVSELAETEAKIRALREALCGG